VKTDAFTEMMCKETGPRQSGSEGIAKARRLLAKRLGELGAVNITEENVAVGVWTPGKPVIKTADKIYGERECLHCLGSSPGTITAAIPPKGIPMNLKTGEFENSLIHRLSRSKRWVAPQRSPIYAAI